MNLTKLVFRTPPRKICANFLAFSLVLAMGAMAASDHTSIFGFENATDWTVTSGTGVFQQTTLASLVAEGAAALLIKPQGYTMIQSRPFSTRAIRGLDTLRMQVRIPQNLGNPNWPGDLQIFLTVPSANQWRQPIGQAVFQGLPQGQFIPVAMPIPTGLKTVLNGNYDDAFLELALNGPDSSDAYVLAGFSSERVAYSLHFDEQDDGRGLLQFWRPNSLGAITAEYHTGSLASVLGSMQTTAEGGVLEIQGLHSGDTLHYRASYLVAGTTLWTSWMSQVLQGNHRNLALETGTVLVKPYDASIPIVVDSTVQSKHYAVAVFRKDLDPNGRAALVNSGLTIVQSAHSSAQANYWLAYQGSVNQWATWLQGEFPDFLNLVPVPRQKNVSRAVRPTTVAGAPLLIRAGCWSDVPLTLCQSKIGAYATNGQAVGTQSGGITLSILEANIAALASLDELEYAFEYSLELPTLGQTIRVMNVDSLRWRVPGGIAAFESNSNIVDADWLQGFPYTGEDIVVGVYDTGVDSLHNSFRAGGVLRNAYPFGASFIPSLLSIRMTSDSLWKNVDTSHKAGWHGTYVAGIAGGNMGLAPKVELWAGDIQLLYEKEIGHVTNHSHEGDRYYYSSATNQDAVLHSQIFLDGRHKAIIAAAANEGVGDTHHTERGYYSILQVSKNEIVVGAVDKAKVRANFSSMGPTYDGRIKPDVMAVGVALTSAYPTWISPAYEEQPNADNPLTKTAGGTSAASPVVAGIAALMQQKARNTIDGCTPSVPCPQFDSLALRNSTVKAILIQTAADMWQELGDPVADSLNTDQRNPDQIATEGRKSYVFFGSGPDFATGWGLVDGEKAVDHVASELMREQSIADGQWDTLYFDVSPLDPRGVPKVTIAWDDVAGKSVPDITQSQLRNDIDLHLVDPDGVAHYPWKLRPFLGENSFIPSVADSVWLLISKRKGIEPITERRVTQHFAYKECFDSLRVDREADRPELCYDHLNNVEQVDAASGQYDWVGGWDYNRMVDRNLKPGQWKVVLHGYRIVDGPQLVSVSSDYPFTAKADSSLLGLWVSHDASGCPALYPTPIFSDPGLRFINTYGGFTGSYNVKPLSLCAQYGLGSSVTSLDVAANTLAPQGYSYVPSINSPAGAQGYDLLLPSGSVLLQSYSAALGSPIVRARLISNLTEYQEPDHGWTVLPIIQGGSIVTGSPTNYSTQYTGGIERSLAYRKIEASPITDIQAVSADSANVPCPAGYERATWDLGIHTSTNTIDACVNRHFSNNLACNGYSHLQEIQWSSVCPTPHANACQIDQASIPPYWSCPFGFERENVDANCATNQTYTYLCVARNPAETQSVLDIQARAYNQPYTGSQWGSLQGYAQIAIQSNVQGKYTYLYSKKGFATATEPPLRELSAVAWDSTDPAVDSQWQRDSLDLNQGHDGHFVYLIYRK